MQEAAGPVQMGRTNSIPVLGEDGLTLHLRQAAKKGCWKLEVSNVGWKPVSSDTQTHIKHLIERHAKLDGRPDVENDGRFCTYFFSGLLGQNT